MKLWKNKKTSCVPGKSSSSIGKNEDSRIESANSSTTISGMLRTYISQFTQRFKSGYKEINNLKNCNLKRLQTIHTTRIAT